MPQQHIEQTGQAGPERQVIGPDGPAGSTAPLRAGRGPNAGKAAVVVLGMHRSGTSALARVLNLLGCSLPKTLMPAGKGNEAGHWESEAIRQFNDRLLQSAGTTWNDWLAFNPGWHCSPRAGEFRDEALALLAGEYGSSRLFVMKDPRICRMPSFWLETLEAFGAAPLVVLPVRNPLEVAASLAKRDDIDPSIGHLLWLRHVLDAEWTTRGLRRCVLSYDGLMSGWRVQIERLQAALDLSLPRLSEAAAMEIEAFLSQQHRHERADPANVIDNPGLSSWLRESFAVFERWARQGESVDDFATLDRIRAQFDAAAPAFARPLAIGRQAVDERRRLERDLGAVRGQLGEREARLAALEREAAAVAKGVADLRGKLAQTESALAQRRHEADQRAAELETARKQISDREGRLAALEREAATATKDLADLRGKLAQTESALAQRRHEADQHAAELESARDELLRMKATRAEHEALIAGYQEHIALLTAGEQQRQTAFAALEDTLCAQMREKDAALEALRQDAAQNSALAAEKEQAIAALQYRTAQHETALEAARRDLAEHLDRHAQEINSLKQSVEQKAREADTLRAGKAADAQKAKAEKQAVEKRLKERFDEIATMTRLMRDSQTQADASRRLVAALVEAGRTPPISLLGRGGLWDRLWVRRKVAALKRAGLFDPEWYLANNADVKKAGVDPAEHYVRHGAKEGRAPRAAETSQ